MTSSDPGEPDDRGHVSMQDLVKATGLSKATVSRALSGHGNLRPETRMFVQRTARSLGYQRSEQKRGRPLTTDPHLIEFVVGRFDTAWTERVVIGARQAAAALRYDLVLTTERDDPDDDWLARVIARRSSGVILSLIRPTLPQLERLEIAAIPLVLIEPISEPTTAIPRIENTDDEGGYQAGSALVAPAVRQYIVVAGTPRFRFGRHRIEGFTRAVHERFPDAPIEVVEAQWQRAEVASALGSFLSACTPPVAIFALNDQMAIGVYEVAERLGLRIPEEVRVVGFDDDPSTSHLQPGLTTIRPQHRTMGVHAIHMLRDLRSGGVLMGEERIELPTELVVRGSTVR